MTNRTLLLLPFLAAACVADVSEDSLAQLRTGDFVCPPGCTCTCEPPNTDTDATESSSESSSGTEESSSSGGISSIIDVSNDAGLHTVNFEGLDRQFRIRYPDGFDPQNPGATTLVPVFSFHSRNGDVNHTYYDSFRFRGIVNISIGAANRGWDIAADGVDMPWVQTVIESIEQSPNFTFLQSEERFLIGMSSGSFMSQAVGCGIGATAVVAGAGGIEYPLDDDEIVATPAPATCAHQPTLFLHHGLNDDVVPFYLDRDAAAYAPTIGRNLRTCDLNGDGTTTCHFELGRTGDFISASFSGDLAATGIADRDYWLANNGCDPASAVSISGFTGPRANGQEGTVNWCATTYDGPDCGCEQYTCAGGDVYWCQDEGAHNWVGAHKNTAERVFYSFIY